MRTTAAAMAIIIMIGSLSPSSPETYQFYNGNNYNEDDGSSHGYYYYDRLA